MAVLHVVDEATGTVEFKLIANNLPGDISAEQLSLIIGDMASLAVKWHKPLSARLLPVLGKGWGELTEFDNPFLVNAKLQPLDIK